MAPSKRLAIDDPDGLRRNRINILLIFRIGPCGRAVYFTVEMRRGPEWNHNNNVRMSTTSVDGMKYIVSVGFVAGPLCRRTLSKHSRRKCCQENTNRFHRPDDACDWRRRSRSNAFPITYTYWRHRFPRKKYISKLNALSSLPFSRTHSLSLSLFFKEQPNRFSPVHIFICLPRD